MKRLKYAVILLLGLSMTFMVSCTKDPNNGGNGGGNGGGNNSGGGGNGTYNGHGYVDLGLPSGTLWATCNLGASTSEDYGDYFAWGETTPKTTYNWNNYMYCNNGDYHQLTKYCGKEDYGYNGYTDTLSELLPQDDAATANWGNGWCVPTTKQWEELRRYTVYAESIQNGVIGLLFTATNGKSLFLPAAGMRDSNLFHDGRVGYYWSNHTSPDPSCAKRASFEHGFSNFYEAETSRKYGVPVRPVRSNQ